MTMCPVCQDLKKYWIATSSKPGCLFNHVGGELLCNASDCDTTCLNAAGMNLLTKDCILLFSGGSSEQAWFFNMFLVNEWIESCHWHDPAFANRNDRVLEVYHFCYTSIELSESDFNATTLQTNHGT